MLKSHSTAYNWKQGTLEIALHLQPQAKHEGYDGCYGDKIKFRVAAPPVDGKANAKLIKLLAQTFSVPKSSVTIVRGQQSRDKVVQIQQPQKLPEWIASPEQAV